MHLAALFQQKISCIQRSINQNIISSKALVFHMSQFLNDSVRLVHVNILLLVAIVTKCNLLQV